MHLFQVDALVGCVGIGSLGDCAFLLGMIGAFFYPAARYNRDEDDASLELQKHWVGFLLLCT